MTTESGPILRVRRLSTPGLPTRLGDFEAIAFSDYRDGTEPIALVPGEPTSRPAPLVRVHSRVLDG